MYRKLCCKVTGPLWLIINNQETYNWKLFLTNCHPCDENYIDIYAEMDHTSLNGRK